MRTNIAAVLENLIREYFEFIIYGVSLQKYGHPFHHYIREIWKRYLEESFIIWKVTIDELLEFKSMHNNISPIVQFKMEYSTEQLLF